MALMASPRYAWEYREREIECEHALTAGFDELAVEAGRAGWEPEEVAHALMKIAQDHIWTMVARAASNLGNDGLEQEASPEPATST